MLINKVTSGFVIQTFDTKKGKFVKQEFIAGDEVEYEDVKTGEPSDDDGVCNTYLPFDMIQPT